MSAVRHQNFAAWRVRILKAARDVIGDGETPLTARAHGRAEPLDVLIVDDEADVRDILQELCRKLGFRVTLAHDGRAAIAAINRGMPPYPIVLADLHMPEADGFAVLDAARRAHASCYVVIITGYATIDLAVRAVKAGAYDFVAKPFALGQLELVLSRILDRMALEDENRQLARQSGTLPKRRGDDSLESQVRQLEARVASLERAVLAADRFAVSRRQKSDSPIE
jgi:DNA-binding NtrC family response regulator